METPTKTSYQIVTGFCAADLADKVQVFVDAGFVPVGGVSLNWDGAYSRPGGLAQAVLFTPRQTAR